MWQSFVVSLLQVIFTTQLLHTASDTDQTVVGSSATEPETEDIKNDTSRCEDESSCIDGTGEGISTQYGTHAANTSSAKTDARKPSKILFNDYYTSNVSVFIYNQKINILFNDISISSLSSSQVWLLIVAVSM